MKLATKTIELNGEQVKINACDYDPAVHKLVGGKSEPEKATKAKTLFSGSRK